jgi:hypothetical protein
MIMIMITIMITTTSIEDGAALEQAPKKLTDFFDKSLL